MSNTAKRMTALALAILTLITLLALSACGGGTGGESDAPAPGENTVGEETTAPAETKPHYQTLSGDYSGRTFRVLGMYNDSYPQFTNFEIWSEGETGDIVNDAVFRRNLDIEQQYGVTIEQKLAEADQAHSNTKLYKHIESTVLAGEDSFDIFFIMLRDADQIIANAYSLDMAEFEYIDFSQPYWNQKTIEDISIGGKVYLTNSDFSLIDKKRTYTLMYNRELCSEYSDYKIEDMIYDGSWTLDIMAELCDAVSFDINGDGVPGIEDQWGLGFDSDKGLCSLLIGMGGSLAAKDETGMPVINVGSERMINIAQKIYDSFNGKYNYFFCGQYPWKVTHMRSADASTVFKAGRLLFITSFPQSLVSYSAESDLDYGIITYPKYDESQDGYYTYADLWGCALFGAPVTNPDTSFTGFMLEILSGMSTDTTLKAYYETSCKIKHVYDETSADMLDITFSGIVFDLGTIFDWGGMYSTVISQILSMGGSPAKTFDYVSKWESIKEKAESEMDKTIEIILAREF